MKKINKKLLPFFFFLFVLFFAHTTFAANLNLSPSFGSYNVGNTIKVRVVLSSSDKSANAISANLTFSKDLLTLTSISKTNSLINDWVPVEPTYSNSNGTVNMQGVILTPGYQGSGGTILTLFFKAKAVGTANVNFSNFSVLANDGLGTDISGNSGQASFNISPEKVKKTPTPAQVTPITAPVVTQLTTPVFNDYSQDIIEGDFLVVKGTADPLVNVIINSDNISSSGGIISQSTTVKSDDKGSFNYVSDRTTKGIYVITAQAENQDGILSSKTLPIKISVLATPVPSVCVQTNNNFNILYVVIPIVLFILLLILLITLILRHKHRSTEDDQEEESLPKKNKHNREII